MLYFTVIDLALFTPTHQHSWVEVYVATTSHWSAVLSSLCRALLYMLQTQQINAPQCQAGVSAMRRNAAKPEKSNTRAGWPGPCRQSRGNPIRQHLSRGLKGGSTPPGSSQTRRVQNATVLRTIRWRGWQQPWPDGREKRALRGSQGPDVMWPCKRVWHHAAEG